MRVPYRLAVNTFDHEEIDAIHTTVASGHLTMGERVRTFEAEFAAWVGMKHAVMVNSGSSANLLMVDAMLRRSDREAPWKAGDEILVPALSWPTTVWPLAQLGLVPVFTDIDPATLAIDLGSAAALLSPRTRGMFLLHALGQAPDIERYSAFCRKHGLELLEDVCESLGAFHGRRHAGGFGQMGSFSFYFSHHISTIEGGMIVTDDAALRDELVGLRAHGWVRERSDRAEWKNKFPEIDDRFLFVSAGYNVRPTEIQGSLGSVQLRKLDGMIAARERLAGDVAARLSAAAPWIRMVGADRLPGAGPVPERRARTHSWMTLAFVLHPEAPAGVAAVSRRFEDAGVETRPILAGNLTRHPATARFVTRRADALPRCDEILARGFMIGCHPRPEPGALETLFAAIDSLRSL